MNKEPVNILLYYVVIHRIFVQKQIIEVKFQILFI